MSKKQNKEREVNTYRARREAGGSQTGGTWLMVILMSVAFGIALIWIFSSSTPDEPDPSGRVAGQFTRHVSGEVRDEQGRPLKGVRIAIMNQVEHTGNDGRFDMDVQSADSLVKLVAMLPGHSYPYVRDLDLSQDELDNIKIAFSSSDDPIGQNRESSSPRPAIVDASGTAEVKTTSVASSNLYKFWIDKSWQGILNKREEMSAVGFQLTDIEPYTVRGNQVFAGVWLKVSGSHKLWQAESFAGMSEKGEEFRQEGFQIVDIEILDSGEDIQWLGIWRSRMNMEREAEAGLSWTALLSKRADKQKSQTDLVDIEPYVYKGQQRFAAIWQDDQKLTRVWRAATWEEFLQKWNTFKIEKYALVDLEIIPTGSGNNFIGIWQESTIDHRLWTLSDWDSFMSKRAEFDEAGLALQDLEITLTAQEKKFSGIWVRQ